MAGYPPASEDSSRGRLSNRNAIVASYGIHHSTNAFGDSAIPLLGLSKPGWVYPCRIPAWSVHVQTLEQTVRLSRAFFRPRILLLGCMMFVFSFLENGMVYIIMVIMESERKGSQVCLSDFLRGIFSERAEMGVVGLTTELRYTSSRLCFRMLSDWGRDTLPRRILLR